MKKLTYENLPASDIKGIYCVINRITGQRYIGKGCGEYKNNGISYRLKTYIKLKCKNQIKLYRSLLKYGVDAFDFKILLISNDNQYVLDMESTIIDAWDTINNGLNILPGGDKGRLGMKTSVEVRRKMSISMTGKKRSDEARKRMSISKTGIRLPPFTDEHKNKIRLSLIGHEVSDETREKMCHKVKTYKNIHTGEIWTGHDIDARKKKCFYPGNIKKWGKTKGWIFYEE